MELSLYIHIPFCVEKCLYCDFVSYKVSEAEKGNAVHQYIDALITEIGLYEDVLQNAKIKSIFVGGGTPSSIDGLYILKVINALKRINPLDQLEEFTIEVNPGTLTLEKINAYLSAGVTRISMGVQSAKDSLLKEIGRIHTFNEFLTTYKGLREQGIQNINLDIMFGLPGQTLEDIQYAIKAVSELSPEHISAYSLKLEEGTPMYAMYERGLITLPDEDTEREMYKDICQSLEALGYAQYEISNFAKPGKHSIHNLTYWENKPYLGLGVAAHSKIDQIRFSNVSEIYAYIQKLSKGEKPVQETQTIDSAEDLFETIMLGLRLNAGISIDAINNQYGIDFLEKYHQVIDKLIGQKLVILEDRAFLKLTSLGRDLSNQVFVEFMG